MRDGHGHVERGKIERAGKQGQREIRLERERERERRGRGKKHSFIVCWVNSGAVKAWL